MTANYDFKMMWKEAAVYCFTVRLQNLPGGTTRYSVPLPTVQTILELRFNLVFAEQKARTVAAQPRCSVQSKEHTRHIWYNTHLS